MEGLAELERLRTRRQYAPADELKKSAIGRTWIYGGGGVEQDMLAGAVIAATGGIGEIAIKRKMHHQIWNGDRVGGSSQGSDDRDRAGNDASGIVDNQRVITGIAR